MSRRIISVQCNTEKTTPQAAIEQALADLDRETGKHWQPIHVSTNMIPVSYYMATIIVESLPARYPLTEPLTVDLSASSPLRP